MSIRTKEGLPVSAGPDNPVCDAAHGAARATLELLDQTGLADPERIVRAYNDQTFGAYQPFCSVKEPFVATCQAPLICFGA